MIINRIRSFIGFCTDCPTPTAPAKKPARHKRKPTPGGVDASMLDGTLDHDRVRLYTGCPECRAARGEPCRTASGQARPQHHQARWAKARRAQKARRQRSQRVAVDAARSQ